MEADTRKQAILEDLELLRDKQVYELCKKRGVPKLDTLANRIQNNLEALIDFYQQQLEKEEETADEENFRMLAGLLDGLVKEIETLMKKQPDALINSFKVKNINRVLKPLKELMINEPEIGVLDILEEADLESKTDKTRNTYSDVAIILSHYKVACDRYILRNYPKTGIWD